MKLGVMDAFNLKLTAVFKPAEEGGYLASSAEWPEVFSEGESIDDARSNLFDALKLVTEYHRDQAPPGSNKVASLCS